MKKLFTIFLIALISGCATVQDAKEARGTGKKAVFSATYDEVWDASVRIVDDSNLDLLSNNKSTGEILAQKGLSFASYGENVAMFVEEKSTEATEVEVVSKKSMATNVFARDWSYYILEKLRELFSEVNASE